MEAAERLLAALKSFASAPTNRPGDSGFATQGHALLGKEGTSGRERSDFDLSLM